MKDNSKISNAEPYDLTGSNNDGETNRLFDECKKAAKEHYRKNKNLNIIYYNTTDKNLQIKLMDWQKEFHEEITQEERKNNKQENESKEVNTIEVKNTKKNNKIIGSQKLQATTSLKSITTSVKNTSSYYDTKKHSFLIGNNISSNLEYVLGKKNRNDVEEEFLDLDEMVEMDFPKEYNPILTEMLFKELGQLLIHNRDQKMMVSNKLGEVKNKMKNDDFRLLLCLLRLKKAETEIQPYYSSQKFDLKDVYMTQLGLEEEEQLEQQTEIEDYVKDFIEAEIQY